MTKKLVGYMIFKARKERECADCERVINKGEIAVMDYAVDYSRSFTGANYLAYWLPACYRAGLNDLEQVEFDKALNILIKRGGK